jgi:hypothetical protein
MLGVFGDALLRNTLTIHVSIAVKPMNLTNLLSTMSIPVVTEVETSYPMLYALVLNVIKKKEVIIGSSG